MYRLRIFFPTLFILFLSVGTSAVPLLSDDQEISTTIRKVREYRQQNEGSLLHDFIELLKIPNVASDTENIVRNAEHIRKQFESLGINSQLLTVDGAPPVVYAEILVPGATKTLMVYAHYDGQPIQPKLWDNPAWKPIVRDEEGNILPDEKLKGNINGEWRVYARSAGDDKVSVMASLSGLKAMKANNLSPSVNLKFFFEGEEEAGSDHVVQILDKYTELIQADGWLFCDGPVHQSGEKQLVFGARGITTVKLTTYGPDRALHSGHYGNWAPNPAVRLANLIASMRDDDGKILIANFYDDIQPITESEKQAISEIPPVDDLLRNEFKMGATEANDALLVKRIMLPALNVTGIQSGGVLEYTKNALPPNAHASIGFRLVPNQEPKKVVELLKDHIRKQGYYIVTEEPDAETLRTYAKVLWLRWEKGGYLPIRVSLDLPFSQALIGVLEKGMGKKIVKLPTFGGSLPMSVFYERLQVPMIIFPIANYDNNQHGPNENLRIQNLWDGIEMYAQVFSELGNAWK